jgi:hypothetical protein
MLKNVSYLLDAGWLFFAAWSVAVAILSVAAFGKDFLPRESSPRGTAGHAAKAALPRKS